jgi:hypothetical protein
MISYDMRIGLQAVEDGREEGTSADVKKDGNGEGKPADI